MAQQAVQTTVNTFVKGLITEATPLTFPENASVDELNCTLSKSGLRSRRKGIEYEDSHVLSSFTTNTTDLINTKTWKNVANTAGVEFLVIQIGDTLRFFDKSSSPISANEKSFTVDLATFNAPNNQNVADSKVAVASVEGNLIVTSKAINPFYIEYDPDADTISTTEITPKVRDFEWQGNTDEYFNEEPVSTVTEERKYDTYNAGWTSFPLTSHPDAADDAYITANNAWPPLTHAWWTGGDPSDPDSEDRQFKQAFWKEVFAGTSLSGNGHFILELFNKNRTGAVNDDDKIDGSVSLDTETEETRFRDVASFAGRAWFAGLSSKRNGSKVFFSPVIESFSDVGNFYQVGDPTSEDSPDLVDSDGGVINIQNAINIRKLYEWGNTLLVFAENGVWQISGPDGLFSATEYFVSRVRGAGGLENVDSVVDAEGTPIYWGLTGIFTVSANDVTGEAEGRDISRGTIQTFWDNIGPGHRSRAFGIYDEFTKQVFWLYGTDNTIDYKYNGVLILDTVLRAFVPWKFVDEDTNTNYVVGASFFTGLGIFNNTFDVVSSSGTNDVVSNSGTDDVVATIANESVDGPTEIRFLVRDGTTGSLTFATITEDSFLDWGTEDFSSYADAFYVFDQDLSTRKNNIYVTTYFNLTETGFTGDETNGYDFINPSACTLKVFWDLRNTVSSSQEVYRHLRPIVVDPNDLSTFAYPYDSIVTRNRVRGRGRVLKLRFESVTQKDFQLQGYEVINAKNQGL